MNLLVLFGSAGIDPRAANPMIVLGLLAWTGVLLWRAWRCHESGTARFVAATLGLVVVSRVMFMVEEEPNPDTSTWLAAAATVHHHTDPFWTLLTYSDSRPLTVLPLVVAGVAGARPGFVMAEVVGLVCWLGTLVLFYRILRLHLRPSLSLLGCWTVALFVGTTGFFDHIGYNSENFAVFMVTLGTFAVLHLARNAAVTPLAAGMLGLLLGCFPFEKMQIVPAGIALAGFALAVMLRRGSWGAAMALVIGGILPTALLLGCYEMRGEGSAFWNTYFWRYYYYSYSGEFSPMLPEWRFRPGRIIRFVFGNGWSSVFLLGQSIVIIAGCFALGKNLPRRFANDGERQLRLSFLVLPASLYAVLQAGNNYEHYLLLLVVPLVHATSVIIALNKTAWQLPLLALALGSALVQGMVNSWWREPLPESRTAAADQRIARLIQANSQRGERMVAWGYADRLHVLADRPMGYRFANSFYVYAPLKALKDYDLRQFADDLEKNRPALFVDAMTPEISLYGRWTLQHDHFPLVASCINRLYRQVAATDGVRIYRRRERADILPVESLTHEIALPPP